MFRNYRTFCIIVFILLVAPIFAWSQTPDIQPVVVGTPQVGEEYWVEVRVGASVPVSNLFGLSLKLKASSTNTVYIDGSAERGSLMGSGVLEFFRLVDNQTVDLAVSKTSPPGVNGSGLFARAKFRSDVAETVTFTLVGVEAINANGDPITLDVKSGSITFTTTTPNPSPTITSVSPTSGTQGQSLTVSVSGSGFVADVSSISFGAGIEVASFSVASPSSASAQIQISASATAGSRSVTVTNPAPGGGTATLNAGFTVNAAPAPVLSVTPASLSASASGGNQSYTITNTGTGTLNWTAVSNQPWVTLGTSSGTGNASITVSVAANASSSARSATITVTATGAANSPQTISVSQAGTTPSPILSVTPTTGSFPPEGGFVDVNITNTGTGTLNWEAQLDQTWVTVSSGSGSGNTTIRVTAVANASSSSRSATLTISASGAGNSPQTVQLSQDGISLSPPTVTTSAASNVSTNEATLGGDVTDDGGSPIGARGVCISTSPSPTLGSNCTNASTAGLGSFSVVVSGLSQNTPYYARAFATNDAGTAYGDNVTFTTQGTSNPAPTVVSVTPDGASRGTTVQVTINGSNFATSGISVQAGTGVTVSNVVRSSSTSITAQFAVSTGATLGYRSVVVTNPSPGGGASNSNVTFAVTLPPPNPTGFVWTPGVTVPTSPKPTFEWLPVSGAINYTVQVSNLENFPQKVACTDNCQYALENDFTNTYTVTGTSYTLPTALPSGATYYWRLRSNTSTVSGVWSTPYRFVVNTPPNTPALVAPDNGVTGLTGSVQLIWTPTSNTASYELQVSADVTFSDLVVSTDTLTISRYQMSAFQAGSPIDYFWRVRSVGEGNNPGSWTDVRFFRRAALTSDDSNPVGLPLTFELHPNYPNPFNPTTVIRYSLPEGQNVQLRLYSVTGRLVRTLQQVYMSAGIHEYTLEASDLPSGVYYVTISGSSASKSIPITLIK